MQTTKPQWKTPQVVRYGSFEELTQGCDKQLGSYDGFTFQGTPVVCVS